MPFKSIFFIGFLFLTSCLFSQEQEEMYSFPDCEFTAIGHRGYSDIYPENTLLGIEEAFKRGVKYCEIDINVTSDDVYVLFHDQPTMYRTSSGTSYVVSSTYKELLELDLGSWKGSQFTGIKIATLEEALLLAEKYDAYLYLDTKKNRIDLIAKALQSSKVLPKRLLPAIGDIEEAKEFHIACPESSFVYFGGIPENINDDNWYKELIDLGCTFFETYYTAAIDNTREFELFVKKVHQHGAKVWVFTSNNMNEIKTMLANGVDGVESDIASSAMNVICNNAMLNPTPIKATTGNWNFDRGNLSSTGVGSQFRPLNYRGTDSTQMVQFGNTTSFDVKPINGAEATIAKIPPFDPENGLFLFTNFTPDSNEDLHYNYTLLIDLYIPKQNVISFVSLLQTSPTNANDGDFFIRSGRLGIDNDYHGNLLRETWYRIALVVSKDAIKKYVNGNYIGETAISGGRWSVYNVFPGGQNQGFLLFADNDNETGELFVNAIQLRNYSMAEEEVKNLGGPNAEGIAISNTGIYNVAFEDEIKPSIVIWDTHEIYAFLSNEYDLTNVKITYDMPFGASATLKTNTELNFEKNNLITIEIKAQDNYSKTKWTIVSIIE